MTEPQPLLSLEEAARFLNVSKSSIRRWTNAGQLNCVRVGVRGERRFRREDLERFVEGETGLGAPRTSEPGGETDPIRILDAAAEQGVSRHVCVHFHDRDELWRLFRPYVLHHLQQAAPIFYIHDAGARGDVLARIGAEGWDPETLMESGLLELREPTEAYLRTGRFSASRMVDFMESHCLSARAHGHDRMLISGEMTWYLTGAEGVEEMIDYEARLNDMLQRYPDVTIVCHYDLNRLSGKITLGALCAHPHAHLPDERMVQGFYTVN